MSDLTAQEQAHVRAALRFLRARCGGWGPAAKAVRTNRLQLSRVARGRTVSASMAVRVARFFGATVDDVLTGRFPPPGTCPYCGHRTEDAPP